jgi:hypothetical protein
MSFQAGTFPDGGFYVHGLRVAHSACRFSAWFAADGALLDCERIDSLRRSNPATESQRADIARRADDLRRYAAA